MAPAGEGQYSDPGTSWPQNLKFEWLGLLDTELLKIKMSTEQDSWLLMDSHFWAESPVLIVFKEHDLEGFEKYTAIN